MPLEDTVLSLLSLYGVDIGIKTEEFYSLSKLVQELSGFKLPPNRPIVGDSLYHIESGIVSMFHRRCRNVEPLEYLPFAPELVGRPGVDIALGKGSGIANIEEHLERRGRAATTDQMNEILARVKQTSMDKKGLLSGEEFDQIMNAVLA